MHNLLEWFGCAGNGAIAKLSRDLREGGDFEGCLDLIQGFAMRGETDAQAIDGNGAVLVLVDGNIDVAVGKVVIGVVPVPAQ